MLNTDHNDNDNNGNDRSDNGHNILGCIDHDRCGGNKRIRISLERCVFIHNPTRRNGSHRCYGSHRRTGATRDSRDSR